MSPADFGPGIRRAVVAGIALVTVLLIVTSQWEIPGECGQRCRMAG